MLDSPSSTDVQKEETFFGVKISLKCCTQLTFTVFHFKEKKKYNT